MTHTSKTHTGQIYISVVNFTCVCSPLWLSWQYHTALCIARLPSLTCLPLPTYLVVDRSNTMLNVDFHMVPAG